MKNKKNENGKQDSIIIENEIRRLSKTSIIEVYQEFNSSKKGLNPVDVEDIFEIYGKNIIRDRKSVV